MDVVNPFKCLDSGLSEDDSPQYDVEMRVGERQKICEETRKMCDVRSVSVEVKGVRGKEIECERGKKVRL